MFASHNLHWVNIQKKHTKKQNSYRSLRERQPNETRCQNRSRGFTDEEAQMAPKHRRSRSVFQWAGNHKSKPHTAYHPPDWQLLTCLTILAARIGQNAERREVSPTAEGSGSYCSHFVNTSWQRLVELNVHKAGPSNPTVRKFLHTATRSHGQESS